MYTFGILIFFSALVVGIIYRTSLRENLIPATFIAILITFVGTTIVNGICGLDHQFEMERVRERKLSLGTSEISTADTTIKIEAFIIFYYCEREDSTIRRQSIEVNRLDPFYIHEERLNRLTISYLPEGDTIPRVDIYRDKRKISSKWVTSFGVPNGHRYFHAHIPNDSIHNVLMDHINSKFYAEKERRSDLN